MVSRSIKANDENVARFGREETAVHKRIRNLPEPEQDDEAALKGYVDHRMLQMKPVITIWAEGYGPISSLEFEWSFGEFSSSRRKMS